MKLHSTEIRTSISPSSAVELNTTSALANYATETLNSGKVYGDGFTSDFVLWPVYWCKYVYIPDEGNRYLWSQTLTSEGYQSLNGRRCPKVDSGAELARGLDGTAVGT
uniref:Uncharacterized protein n=1 Tax=Timema shepardi TaxID=629360 RepID=A0A7R9G3F5_TIMSH|nr:unnamed protein product [Timema shepardi]